LPYFISLIAVALYSPVFAEDREKEEKLYNRAHSLIDNYSGDSGRLKEAHILALKIKKINKNSEYAYVLIGRITYKSGYINYSNYTQESLVEAKIHFSKAISLNPRFYDAYIYGAYPYIFSKDYPAAKKMLAKAEKLRPDSEKVDIVYSEIALKEKNYDEVIRRCKSAISKSSDRKTLYEAHEALSKAYRKIKKYKLAEQSYLMLIKLEPKSSWAKINYSNFLSKYKQEHDKAIEVAEQALEIMDFGMGHHILSEANYRKAVQLMRNRKYPEAGKYFKDSLKHNPSSANSHYGLGMSLYYVGHYEKNKSIILKAEKSLSTALEIDPKHKQAKAQLANVRKLIKAINE